MTANAPGNALSARARSRTARTESPSMATVPAKRASGRRESAGEGCAIEPRALTHAVATHASSAPRIIAFSVDRRDMKLVPTGVARSAEHFPGALEVHDGV
jgi:hypothetical protein